MADENLIGYIEQNETLSGIVSDHEELIGTISMENEGLIGTLIYGTDSTIEDFEGPYYTIPSTDPQIFETKDKKMTDDFIVDATPISDIQTAGTDGYTITVL